MPLTHTLVGGCPGGWCDHIAAASEILVVLLLADCFIFLVTLLPPLFTWKDRRPDSRSRIYFAAFACLTFYFWLAVLGLHSAYCFGFLAHAGMAGREAYCIAKTTTIG
jgi:Kef-type K+ transport system membrane component KefB